MMVKHTWIVEIETDSPDGRKVALAVAEDARWKLTDGLSRRVVSVYELNADASSIVSVGGLLAEFGSEEP